MKKFIFLLVVLMTATTIAWCKSNKSDTSATDTWTGISCTTAVQNYLDKADMKGRWDTTVASGNNIVVDYIGRLADGTVFDTSVESVAQACGKYNPGRDYTSWLPFQVGAWQMIAGFDNGVVGMKLGQTKTITIPAKDAYGERSKDKLITVDKSQVPNADQYKKGTQVMTDYGQVFTVYDITDTSVIFDGNHELAGKDLTFDITIKAIK